MAHAIEAPAQSTTAEGLTSHTPIPAQLTAPQLRLLHRGLDPKRVGKDNKGFAHMEAWDIKRYLLRVFGFGGYDTENLELALVREIDNNGRWTVVYRAQVRLTVKDVHGRVVGHWDGEAVGDSYNQPKIGDAHDMAMKTAASQALKRAATNLGDQFGLSLYNNGSPMPVVGFCAAHPPAEWEKVAEPVPEPDDPPVQGEQQGPPQEGETAPAVPEQTPKAEDPLPRLMKQYQDPDVWNNAVALLQIRLAGKKHQVSDRSVQAPDGSWTKFDALLEARIDELKPANAERSAA